MESSVVKSKPQVSVIMPSYNTADLIAGSLDSILQQTFSDFEIIVVNDGSPDTTELEKVLASYMTRIVYIKQENKRASGARNTAIGKARGEFLAFLDSDDIWLPDHLLSQMQLFEQNPALDLVYCNCLSVGDPTRPHDFMSRCPSHGAATFLALVMERCQIPVSTVVARKSALVRAGLFDENLARCDDYDMWLRAAFHGAKIGYTQKVQTRQSGGRPGSLAESRAKMAEAYWKILEKADQTLPLTSSDHEVVQKRANEIHGRYLLEEGKIQLHRGQWIEAKKLLSEANSYLRRPALSLVLLGLKIAPGTTSKLVAFVSRIRDKTQGS
ncbi:MAG TPA: glycosyltransferase family A protein [Bryobacteraceae bacterium]